MTAMSTTRPVPYLFGSAAPPVLGLAQVVRQAQFRGWEVVLGLTPTAASWLQDELPRSVATLREAGVRVLLGEGGFVPNAPGQEDPVTYPWEAALGGVEEFVRR